jgi:hypothetical protein
MTPMCGSRRTWPKSPPTSTTPTTARRAGAILDDDPHTQRARFDVIEDMSSAPTHDPATLLRTAATTLVAS